MTTRSQPNNHHRRKLEELVRAASVCGCATCRHAVRARAIKEQADDMFARAFADLTATKDLPWLIRKKAA